LGIGWQKKEVATNSTIINGPPRTPTLKAQ
jgi:hypothetical protein